MSTATPVLINIFEAASIVDMKHTRLARLAREGRVPHVRLPDGEPRFIKDELYEWIREHRVPQEKPCQ